MKLSVAAFVAAAMIAPTASFAQSDIMGPALSMLELSVTRSLSAVGVDGVDMASLTLSQLTQIKATLDDDETSVSRKRTTIQRIIDGS